MTSQGSSISRLILGEAAWLVLLGLLLGICGSFFMGRLLTSLLFGVRSWDLSILAGITVVLGVAALNAALIPARRAAAIDPMEALRTE